MGFISFLHSEVRAAMTIMPVLPQFPLGMQRGGQEKDNGAGEWGKGGAFQHKTIISFM